MLLKSDRWSCGASESVALLYEEIPETPLSPDMLLYLLAFDALDIPVKPEAMEALSPRPLASSSAISSISSSSSMILSNLASRSSSCRWRFWLLYASSAYHWRVTRALMTRWQMAQQHPSPSSNACCSPKCSHSSRSTSWPSLVSSAKMSSSSSTYSSSSRASSTSRNLGSMSGWNPAISSGTSCWSWLLASLAMLEPPTL
ncbi:hypothetical protein KC328_g56 [Hortaea werneckii]|nr:hypothetical protein KC328_g56 [Hortaea werneckii]